MSIFPTMILLATDGSSEAELAATTAADLAKSTGSELHVVHVGELLPTVLAQTEFPSVAVRISTPRRKAQAGS